MSNLRQFLASISEGTSWRGRRPAALADIARGVLRRLRQPSGADDVEDLVSEYVARLIEEKARRRSGIDWRQATDAEARRLVARRCKQIALEQRPGWSAYRSLREHVATAMERGLPEAPGHWPGTLLEGDRYSLKLVAAAAAHVLATNPQLEGNAGGIATVLSRNYCPQLSATDEPLDVGDDQDWLLDVSDRLDGVRVAGELQRELGPELSRTWARRLNGWGFEKLAGESHVALATAFARCRRAEREASAALVRAGCSPRAARWALHAFASRAA